MDGPGRAAARIGVRTALLLFLSFCAELNQSRASACQPTSFRSQIRPMSAPVTAVFFLPADRRYDSTLPGARLVGGHRVQLRANLSIKSSALSTRKRAHSKNAAPQISE